LKAELWEMPLATHCVYMYFANVNYVINIRLMDIFSRLNEK